MGFGNAMAEDVIWQEDWSTWGDYEKKVLDGVNSNYTFEGTVTNTDGSFKSGTTIYKEALAGGEAPELLIAKSSGSFTASINLNGKSGDMTLSFKCNKNIPVEVTGGTIGKNAGSGNDYVYPITGASGTLTIKFGCVSTNARLDNIKLFQGQGKQPAGLSFGTSSRTVTLGADDNVFPTLQNDNNLAVTYSSSETSVATIAADGTITLVAAGQTVITAESAETAEFEAGHAQYTLTVKEAETPEPPAQEITVARALEIISGLDDGATTTDKYKVKGFIVGTPDFQRDKNGKLYGNCNFEIADTKGGTTTLTVFRSKSFDNKNFTDDEVTANILKEGDEVVLEGNLQKYKSGDNITPEIKNCYLISINGETSHVSALKADFQNAPAYNVGGQRVNQGYKGLVIKGGKKLIQK